MCQEGHPDLEGEQTFSALRRVVERSPSPLEALYFEHGKVREEDVGAVLRRATPALKDLRLVDVNLGVLPLGDSEVVPDLRVLHLSSHVGFDRAVWVDVVKARAGKLEEVRIEKTGEELAVVLEASRGMDGLGLVIH